MCYSALVERDLNALKQLFGATFSQDQFDRYNQRHAMDPKRFPEQRPRIFPGSYAPIITVANGQRVIDFMRYGAYPPSSVKNPSAYTTFNARRDNLTSSFWSEAFRKQHGFVVLKGFFEWVAVKDLLKAGVVTLDFVIAEFKRQSEERAENLKAKGKQYKPTPTELKDPRFRQIVIEFKPVDQTMMLVPVICSTSQLPNFGEDRGFAIITDDPPDEVSAAGHDRCPIVLSLEQVPLWLDCTQKSASDFDKLLSTKTLPHFTHMLAPSA